MIAVDKIINEDGTDYNPPKNPLEEKWERLYPGCKASGYKCMYCGDCPHGEYWTVPNEDRDIYDAYLETIKQYNIKHGNFMIPRIIFKEVD